MRLKLKKQRNRSDSTGLNAFGCTGYPPISIGGLHRHHGGFFVFFNIKNASKDNKIEKDTSARR